MEKYLAETKMLDFSNPKIQSLIEDLAIKGKMDRIKIEKAYRFIRDDVQFGYNTDDAIPASIVLTDGYGQCNTKGTLFMAVLRGLGIPCRLHGFTIHKKLQKGAMTGIVYKSAPDEIVHSWVEVFCEGEWYNLEGFILDIDYLHALQKKFSDCMGGFCGYGVATDDFINPPIEWNLCDTYIQNKGIVRDYGVFDSPDLFFARHSQELGRIKGILYRNLGRHLMNRNIRKIRDRV